MDVSYTVKNTDSKDMYFFIGGHPAFSVPDFDDLEVRYEKPKKIVRTVNGKETVIADNVFMKDAPASSWVALVDKKTGGSIKLRYDNKGCIAVWSSYFEEKELTEQAQLLFRQDSLAENAKNH